jgi:copper chaperone CopZ
VKDGAIHCSNCEARIHKILRNSVGIIKVLANQDTQEIKVIFDIERINLQKIKQILEDLGFPVR